MKIELKKEKFESIDKAFTDMKENKSKRQHAANIIRSNLKSMFNKNININIIESGPKDNFFIMSIYPSESTLDKVVEAIINEDNDSLIRKIWLETNEWNIEIDCKILNGNPISFTSRELTGLLLHEIGHIVYSNSIPQRISKVMKLEYAKAHIEIKKMLKNKGFAAVLKLPIIQACEYDNYKTHSSIKKELKADAFAVKMGYGDELNNVLTKLITSVDVKQVTDIDKSSQEVYNNMKSITNFSLNTLKDFKERKVKVNNDNLKKLMFANPSKFVKHVVDNISNILVDPKYKFESYNSDYSKYMKIYNAYCEAADNMVDDLYLEFTLFPTKRLKKIDPYDIDYIIVEKNNIKTNDDKMLLISYIHTKLDTINYYLSLLNNNSTGYVVPHTTSELTSLKNKLEKIKTEVLNYKIPEIKYGISISYPEGYEG